jgi:hypothetical protein
MIWIIPSWFTQPKSILKMIVLRRVRQRCRRQRPMIQGEEKEEALMPVGPTRT